MAGNPGKKDNDKGSDEIDLAEMKTKRRWGNERFSVAEATEDEGEGEKG
jgi:hypothetical protein